MGGNRDRVSAIPIILMTYPLHYAFQCPTVTALKLQRHQVPLEAKAMVIKHCTGGSDGRQPHISAPRGRDEWGPTSCIWVASSARKPLFGLRPRGGEIGMEKNE